MALNSSWGFGPSNLRWRIAADGGDVLIQRGVSRPLARVVEDAEFRGLYRIQHPPSPGLHERDEARLIAQGLATRRQD
jgi:hypothetical protein